jgi:diguanylate cyclase (GGDEF)-like protein
LDRSPTATIATIGGRLVAALLPLAAVAVIRGFPTLQQAPSPWLSPAFFAAAAVLAAIALLLAVAAALEDGRIRDLADVAGLGLVAASFAVVALDAAADLGLGIGLTGAAALFLIGSVVRPRTLATRGERVVGLVVAVVLVDAGLGGVLLASGSTVSTGQILLASGAAVMGLAAIASLDDATRATALGIAASGVAALAIGGPSGNETLAGAAGMGAGAAVLSWRLLIGRTRRVPAAEALPALPELPIPATDPPGEPEFDELSRITRELRATLDDLVAARHLIELQRIEIDRAASIDQLTGLASRWPTLDRLRNEAAEARRYSHPVAVVLFDIDAFTELNHEHGLEAGDAILREVALRLRVRMREADAVGRIGADAFLAILPHTDEGGAANFATAVLERLLERRIVTPRGEVTVALSIGIALMRPGMTLSGEELLAAAEEALASARAAGGNRIAFDRLHGLARLDDREGTREATSDDPASGAQPS